MTQAYKLICFIVLCCFFYAPRIFAQSTELGIGFGISGFLGDLGGANAIGGPFIQDLETSLTKPALSFQFRYTATKRFAIKASISYTEVAGDDKLITYHSVYSPEWYRWYRNLNFTSDIIEGAFIGEYQISQFEAGSKFFRSAPFAFAGLGVFHFNPKTNHNGTEVELQPLHTEGQNFSGSGNSSYSLLQPCLLLGAGYKFNAGARWVIDFTIGHRMTFTDYIDDVSKSYVAQDEFANHFGSNPDMASLAFELSMRADELSAYTGNEYIVADGQQRGDPNDKDQYFMMQLSLNYVLNTANPYNSGFISKKGTYPHRIWNQNQMFKKRKRH